MMKRLKILHVGNHTHPCIGGVENVIWQSAREQVKLGHEVEVMVFNTCSGGGSLPSVEKIDGVSIHRVPQKGPAFYRMPPQNVLLERARGKDIIHIHGVGAWLDTLARAKNSLRGKLILTTHGGFFHTSQRRLLKWVYAHFFLPFAWNKMDGIIYVSPSDKEHFSFLPQEKTVIILNGIEEDYFELSSSKKERETFVFVGRLSKNKRVDRLIETFALFSKQKKRKDAALYLVGKDWEGIQRDLEVLVRQKGLEGNVIFSGEVSMVEKLKILSRARVFVSASEYEGFGISAVEAMGAGCIPCLNDISSFRQFAEGGKGFVVDYSSAQNASQTWEKIISMSPQEQAAMRKKALAYSKELAWPTLVKKQIEFYHSLVKK